MKQTHMPDRRVEAQHRVNNALDRVTSALGITKVDYPRVEYKRGTGDLTYIYANRTVVMRDIEEQGHSEQLQRIFEMHEAVHHVRAVKNGYTKLPNGSIGKIHEDAIATLIPALVLGQGKDDIVIELVRELGTIHGFIESPETHLQDEVLARVGYAFGYTTAFAVSDLSQADKLELAKKMILIPNEAIGDAMQGIIDSNPNAARLDKEVADPIMGRLVEVLDALQNGREPKKYEPPEFIRILRE